MSVADIDSAVCRRMKDYLRPEDLDTDACVNLAGEILSGLADDLSEAAVRAAECPTRGNLDALRALRKLYRSDYYKALSAGVADGETVCRRIIREALSGRKVGGEAET